MSKRVTPKINKGKSVRSFPRRFAHGWLTKSKSISIFVSLMLFGSSLVMASTQLATPKPLILESSEVTRQQLPPLTATPTYFSHQSHLVSQLSIAKSPSVKHF